MKGITESHCALAIARSTAASANVVTDRDEIAVKAILPGPIPLVPLDLVFTCFVAGTFGYVRRSELYPTTLPVVQDADKPRRILRVTPRRIGSAERVDADHSDDNVKATLTGDLTKIADSPAKDRHQGGRPCSQPPSVKNTCRRRLDRSQCLSTCH